VLSVRVDLGRRVRLQGTAGRWLAVRVYSCRGLLMRSWADGRSGQRRRSALPEPWSNPLPGALPTGQGQVRPLPRHCPPRPRHEKERSHQRRRPADPHSCSPEHAAPPEPAGQPGTGIGGGARRDVSNSPL